jgi:hypothetical protein
MVGIEAMDWFNIFVSIKGFVAAFFTSAAIMLPTAGPMSVPVDTVTEPAQEVVVERVVKASEAIETTEEVAPSVVFVVVEAEKRHAEVKTAEETKAEEREVAEKEWEEAVKRQEANDAARVKELKKLIFDIDEAIKAATEKKEYDIAVIKYQKKGDAELIWNVEAAYSVEVAVLEQKRALLEAEVAKLEM